MWSDNQAAIGIGQRYTTFWIVFVYGKLCDGAETVSYKQLFFCFEQCNQVFWCSEVGQEFAPGGVGVGLEEEGVDGEGVVDVEGMELGGADMGVVLVVEVEVADIVRGEEAGP